MQEPILPKPTDGSALDASFRNYAGRTPFCQLLGSQNPEFPELQVPISFAFAFFDRDACLTPWLHLLHLSYFRLYFSLQCFSVFITGSVSHRLCSMRPTAYTRLPFNLQVFCSISHLLCAISSIVLTHRKAHAHPRHRAELLCFSSSCWGGFLRPRAPSRRRL